MRNSFLNTDLGKIKIAIKQGTPLVVFLKGAGSFDTEKVFEPIIEKLPDNYGIYAPDYLNTGFSSSANKEYSISQEANILSKNINEINAKQVIIVAHSMGGIYALQMLDKVKHVIGFLGIEPTTREIIANPPKTQEYEQKSQITPQELTNLLINKTTTLFGAKDSEYFWATTEKNQNKFSSQDNERLEKSFENSWNTDLIVKDDIPSIIVTEKFRREEYLRSEFNSKNDDSKIIVMGDTHYIQWEYPDEIANLIKSFKD